MKAVLEHIAPQQSNSVLFREIRQKNFDTPYHYHPEMELTYIEKGKGTRHVGMKMEEFEESDLVFVGANVPHCWLNVSDETQTHVASYVVQFREHIFTDTLLKLPEFAEIKELFKLAQKGVKFTGKKFRKDIIEIFEQEEPQRILALLSLLQKLSQAEKTILLDIEPITKTNPDRFHLVFAYLIEHFREPISLETIAQIAGLSTNSFCRYFKEVTGNTLFEVILNYRIEAAAQLVVASQKRIGEIAFETGFQDIPYFNRVFKKKTGLSPSGFRKKYIA